ncbi:hypothetical protein A1O1_04718, partial [Capronia coronata CBS 617.96]
MEGECLCKAVRVKVNDDNLFGDQRRGHLCHCASCRKVAGGPFGANLIIEEEKVEFPKGKDNLRVYEDPETLSGTPVQRYFCQTCGVPIMSMTPLLKGKIVLKLGIYAKLPVPEWESFASRRQAWEKPVEGAVQYKTK